jgi:CspA family cold shock protein
MSEVVPATESREEGICKWWNTHRHFGMLIPILGGQEVFVHGNQLEFEPRELVEGERISFEWAKGQKGPKANHVRRVTCRKS